METDIKKLVKSLTLFNDNRMKFFFKDAPELIEETISIILGKNLKLIDYHVQDINTSDDEISKNVIFDVYAEDQEGKLYDVEIQNGMEDMPLKRARYYSSILDMKLEKGKDYKDLPETYVIIIANVDPFYKNQRIYKFDRVIIVDNEQLDETDESHILFVNGTIIGKEDKLSMLMHDFNCNRSKDMYLSSFKKRMKYQESRREIDKMCEKELAFWQPRIDETRTKSLEEGKSEGRLQGKTEATLDMVKNLLNLNVSIDIIEASSKMSKEDILKIKEKLN